MTDGQEPSGMDPNEVKSAIKGWIFIAALTVGILGAGLVYLEM